jgi:hypothetical protein
MDDNEFEMKEPGEEDLDEKKLKDPLTDDLLDEEGVEDIDKLIDEEEEEDEEDSFDDPVE